MQTCRVWTVAVAVCLLVPALPHAQWPAHPDRDVPRTPDGRVNLQAPTPRTADGKPDFTGVWQNAWFVDGRVQPLLPPGEPPAATFWTSSRTSQATCRFSPGQPSSRQIDEQNSKENPDALPADGSHPVPNASRSRAKVIQTPDVIAILYEGNGGVRQILTDGRSLPTNDPQPWWYGYSIGRWDGDTLVVETSGFRDGGWLDIQEARSPMWRK